MVSMRSSGRFTGVLDSASPAYPERREMTVCVKPGLARRAQPSAIIAGGASSPLRRGRRARGPFSAVAMLMARCPGFAVPTMVVDMPGWLRVKRRTNSIADMPASASTSSMPEVSQFRWPRPGPSSGGRRYPRERQAPAARRPWSGQVDQRRPVVQLERDHPAARPDHPGQLADRPLLIGDIHQDPFGPDAVHRVVAEFQPLHVTDLASDGAAQVGGAAAGTRRSWPGSGRCPARTTARGDPSGQPPQLRGPCRSRSSR